MNNLKHFAIVLCNTIAGITLMYVAFKTGSPIFHMGFMCWAIATYFIGMEIDKLLTNKN